MVVDTNNIVHHGIESEHERRVPMAVLKTSRESRVGQFILAVYGNEWSVRKSVLRIDTSPWAARYRSMHVSPVRAGLSCEIRLNHASCGSSGSGVTPSRPRKLSTVFGEDGQLMPQQMRIPPCVDSERVDPSGWASRNRDFTMMLNRTWSVDVSLWPKI
jgi:hypothetical protein